jgi:universal stress protein E
MKRFQNILVAVDSRQEKHPALQWATRLADFNDAKLKLVDVLPDLPWIAKLTLPDHEETQKVLANQKLQTIDAMAQEIRDQGIDVSTKLLAGKTSFALMHEVLQSHHDLIVRVSKGAHSGRTGFFGTTSMRLLRKCPCAVWLVRPDKPTGFNRVLAAIDPDPDDEAREVLNHEIMDLGKTIAHYENGQLHVVHAWEMFGAHLLQSRSTADDFAAASRITKDRAAKMLDQFLTPYKMTHQSEGVHLLCDELGPGHAISSLAAREQIDLVVMGTIARTGLRGAMIGNTAEQVLDRIECSVLAIKPDNFMAPVTLPDP